LAAASFRSANTSIGRRAVAVLLTGAIHILALLVALTSRGQTIEPVRPTLTTFDVRAPEPPTEQPPTPDPSRSVPVLAPQPVEVPQPPIELPVLPALVVTMLAQADAAGGACDLTAPIQAALRMSPEVQRDLPRIPSSRRSVASAIALWNKTWVVPSDALDGPALTSVRQIIAATIAAASEACRGQLQAGPRLIFLPGEPDTVLAVGSGEWFWQQVADTAQIGPDQSLQPMSHTWPDTLTTAQDPR